MSAIKTEEALERGSSWKKNGNYRAVVLAAGQGSRFPELTNSVSKFLLPVGGIPLLWYPLDLLARSGFREAIVIVREGSKATIEAALDGDKAPLKICYLTIPDNEDLGTADSIRHLGIEGNLVVVSGDLVTSPEVTLESLMVSHLRNGAALTALLSPTPQPLPSQELPGFKQKASYERDLFAYTDDTQQLLQVHSAGNTSHITFEKHIYRNRSFPMASDLTDCHAYVINAPDVDKNIHNRLMSSIRTEVLPMMLRQQFRPSKTLDPDSVLRKILDNYHTTREQMTAVTPRCYISMLSPSLPTQRVNNLLAYVQANRQAAAWYASRPPPASFQLKVGPGGVSGAGVQRTKKSVVQESVLGAKCVVKEKSRVIRSILMPGVTVEEGAKVTDSILLPGVTVGANATVSQCIVALNVAPYTKYHQVVVDAAAEMLDPEEDEAMEEASQEEEDDNNNMDDDE